LNLSSNISPHRVSRSVPFDLHFYPRISSPQSYYPTQLFLPPVPPFFANTLSRRMVAWYRSTSNIECRVFLLHPAVELSPGGYVVFFARFLIKFPRLPVSAFTSSPSFQFFFFLPCQQPNNDRLVEELCGVSPFFPVGPDFEGLLFFSERSPW